MWNLNVEHKDSEKLLISWIAKSFCIRKRTLFVSLKEVVRELIRDLFPQARRRTN